VSGFFVPHDLKAPLSAAGKGALAGLSVAVKDMYDIAGERTGGGSPDWLAHQRPASKNAGAVQRLLDGGATVIGKTVCDEFFYSVAGTNAHYGTPVNVRAPGRLPGGSSSGSAAAAAAGACDFALGSDTGGSVRVPASFCGLYGVRPTLDRVDLTGAMAMAPSFDVAGWFAQGPGVFRRIGDVLLQGERVEAPIERLILADDAFAEADADVAAALQAALQPAAPALPKPTHTRVAPNGFDGWREAFRIIQAREVWSIYGDFVTQARPKLGPGIKERMEAAASVSEKECEAARGVHAQARAHIHSLLPPGTVMALPTTPCVAPPLDITANAMDSFRVRAMRLTCISGMSGLPQVTIPIGTISGCPIGLSFIGWSGGDEVLLDLAVALSRYCGPKH
jgi:amidase